MEKSNTINGIIFIIPNSPERVNKKEDLDDFEQKWINGIENTLKAVGINSIDSPLIQVWAANDECDNFECHYWDYFKMIPQEKPKSFPRYLPYSVLKDLKEGDTLTLNHESGVTIKLTASQLKARYRNFGAFETVLNKLVPYGK